MPLHGTYIDKPMQVPIRLSGPRGNLMTLLLTVREFAIQFCLYKELRIEVDLIILDYHPIIQYFYLWFAIGHV